MTTSTMTTSTMTARRWLVGLLAALLAIAGHLAYHYLPRSRPAVPQSTSRVAALLDQADLPAAVWVPYPHQNLAYMGATLGADSASMRAVARLAGLPTPALPTFGPLALPPSSEIAVASDDAGERFVVVARVYPAVAAFAKLAGRLAGNPWLHGGEIVVEGRTAEVRWQGNLWLVASSELPPEAPEPAVAPRPEAPPEAPGLAWIRIRQAVDPLPAGLSGLGQDDAGIGISSRRSAAASPRGSAEASPRGSAAASPRGSAAASPRGSAEAPARLGLASRLASLKLFLLVYSGRHPALGEPSQALAFFDQEQEKIMEMPRVAALHEPGSSRWELPGEGLLELTGRRPQAATVGEWSIAALDSTSLAEAGRVAPELDAVDAGGLKWGLWLDLGGGLAEVERIARLLGGVPIVPRRQVERWNDARRALSPLAERYSLLTATVSEEPRAFDLFLEAAAK